MQQARTFQLLGRYQLRSHVAALTQTFVKKDVRRTLSLLAQELRPFLLISVMHGHDDLWDVVAGGFKEAIRVAMDPLTTSTVDGFSALSTQQ